MNETTEQRMQHYSETFDFYMDSKMYPDFEPANDTLGQYIQSVVADNPQLDSQDPLWAELLKEDLMRFLQALLSLYEPVEKEHERQSNMIKAFINADMNGKRKMWSEVSRTISQYYQPQEVNVDGYVNQMRQMDEEGKSMALSALAKDWDKANDERKVRLEKEILEKYRKSWERSVCEHGIEDYKRLKKIENEFYNYPALSEIVRIIAKILGQEKTTQRVCNKPRLQMGPIIVAVDTSGSMKGKPERIANSLLMQLVRMAKQKKRKCYLITFSIMAKAIDLAHPANWHQLKDFLADVFSGGTNGEQMFGIALDVLKTETYNLADVLVISDFYFPKPIKKTMNRIREEQYRGVCFYGLQIDSENCKYDGILDRIWKV